MSNEQAPSKNLNSKVATTTKYSTILKKDSTILKKDVTMPAATPSGKAKTNLKASSGKEKTLNSHKSFFKQDCIYCG